MCIAEELTSFRLSYFEFDLSFLAKVVVCLRVWIVLDPGTCFFLISLLNSGLINKTIVTWHLTTVGSVAIV